MFFKSLQSDDIFISYARRDATDYAVKLVDELEKKHFSTFTDRRGTDAGKELPPRLLKQLRSCRMLVVLCTPGTMLSPFVGREVKAFADAKGTRMIVPIVFDQSVMKADWYTVIEGIAPQYEDAARLKTGQPSEEAIKRIVDAFKYSRKEERIKRGIRIGSSVVGVLALLIAVAAVLAVKKGQEASAALSHANEAQRKADVANAAALIAQGNAQAQQLIAEEQGRIAIEQTKKAGDATAEAKKQQGIADQQAKRAAEETRKADSRQRLAEAQLSRFEGEERFQKPVSLAIQSYKLYPSVEPDALLRYGLEKLPPRVTFTNKGDSPAVYAVAYSADGRRLYTAGQDQFVREWDVANQKQLRKFHFVESVHSRYHQYLKFSANAQSVMAVVMNHPERAEVWSVSEGRLASRIEESGSINDIALTDDGTYAATAGSDSVQVWKVGSQRAERTVKHEGQTVIRVLFSPQGDVVASVSIDPENVKNHQLKVWERDTAKDVLPPQSLPECSTITPGYDCSVGLAFSADGRLLAYAKQDRVYVYDLKEGKQFPLIDTGAVTAVAVHSGENMNWVATGHTLSEGLVRIYDLDKGASLLNNFDMQHEAGVQYVAFTPGEQAPFQPSIVSVTSDHKGHLWTSSLLGLKGVVESARLHQGSEIKSVAYSVERGNQLVIATAGTDGVVNQWHSFGPGDPILKHGGTPSADFSQNSRFVVVNSDNKVVVVDTLTGKVRGATNGNLFNAPVVSNDGRYLYLRKPGRLVSIWDIVDNREVRHIDADYFLNDDSATTDLKLVAVQKPNDQVLLWQPFENKAVDLPANLKWVFFSSDNKHFVAATTDDNYGEIWTYSNTDSGKLKLTREKRVNFGAPVWRLKYSAKGSYFVMLSRDGSVSLWRHTGKKVKSLKLESGLLKAAFSGDESHLVVKTGTTVKVFESATGKLIDTIETMGDELTSNSDGRYVATLSDSGISVWEVGTARVYTNIDVKFFPYSSSGRIRFTPDDRMIVAVTDYGTKRFFWKTRDLVQEARSRLNNASHGPGR